MFRSVILPIRGNDNNRNGFHKWPFLSVQQWGENPIGKWTLTILSRASKRNAGLLFIRVHFSSLFAGAVIAE